MLGQYTADTSDPLKEGRVLCSDLPAVCTAHEIREPEKLFLSWTDLQEPGLAGDASGAYCVGFRLGVAVSLPAITAPFEHEEFDGLVWTRRRGQVMQQTRETACAGLFAVGVVVLDGASMREYAEFRAVGMPEIVQQG